MSSDPLLIAQLGELPKNLRDEANLKIIPSSRDSFNNLLSYDSKVSTLEEVIKSLETNDDCIKLKAAEGASSILELVKAEIVVLGSNAGERIQEGIALEEDGALIDKWRLKDLLNRLGPAVVNMFVTSCRGAAIADKCEAKDQCSCYLSVTDSTTFFSPKNLHLWRAQCLMVVQM